MPQAEVPGVCGRLVKHNEERFSFLGFLEYVKVLKQDEKPNFGFPGFEAFSVNLNNLFEIASRPIVKSSIGRQKAGSDLCMLEVQDIPQRPKVCGFDWPNSVVDNKLTCWSLSGVGKLQLQSDKQISMWSINFFKSDVYYSKVGIGSDLRFSNFPSVDCHSPSGYQRLPTCFQSFPKQVDGGKGEQSHAPLRDGILRVNKSTEKPVPRPHHILTVLGLFWLCGYGLARLIRAVGAPEE